MKDVYKPVCGRDYSYCRYRDGATNNCRDKAKIVIPQRYKKIYKIHCLSYKQWVVVEEREFFLIVKNVKTSRKLYLDKYRSKGD